MRSFEQSLLRLGAIAVDRLFVHDLDVASHGDALGMHCSALLDGGLRSTMATRYANPRAIGTWAMSVAHARKARRRTRLWRYHML